MLLRYSALVTVVISGFAAAQSPASQIPACAVPCIESAIQSATTCSPHDTACQCEKSNHLAIQKAALKCITSSCPSSELLAVVSGAATVCAAVETSAEAAAASSYFSITQTSLATTLPSSAARVVETVAQATSATAKPYSAATLTNKASSSKTECPCEATGTTSASNATNVTTTPTIVPYTGSASRMAVSLGSAFMIGLFAFAFL